MVVRSNVIERGMINYEIPFIFQATINEKFEALRLPYFLVCVYVEYTSLKLGLGVVGRTLEKTLFMSVHLTSGKKSIIYGQNSSIMSVTVGHGQNLVNI